MNQTTYVMISLMILAAFLAHLGLHDLAYAVITGLFALAQAPKTKE